ncbi:MAG: hypothetical protein ACI807_003344 [Paracoccaceae bacterium]|jgi:hypothetical protein
MLAKCDGHFITQLDPAGEAFSRLHSNLRSTERNEPIMMIISRYLVGLCICAMGTGPLSAMATGLPQVASDAVFTFRTVQPPDRGTLKRITFPPEGQRPSTPTTRSQWFWDSVSPAREAGAPKRLAQVLNTLGPELSRRGVARGADRVADQVLREYGAALFRSSKRENLSPTLLLAVISVESGGQPNAVSPKGAQGLMQLMPATARRFGVRDALDPAQNIAGGARYLSFLLDMFDQDALLALAAYNAGEGAVTRHGGVPPYSETRDYVARALSGFEVLRARCATPPEGARDPCELTPSKG